MCNLLSIGIFLSLIELLQALIIAWSVCLAV